MQATSKGFKLRDDDDYYDLDNIENYNTQKVNDLIEEIESKMMPGTQTTSQGDNQLANRDFVNSSIAHMAANPRGNWSTWSDVPLDPQYYPEDANHNKKPTNNDYMVVQDMSNYTNPDEPTRTYEGTWRFTYIGEWDDVIPGGTRGKSGWKPIYQVNEKPLTQAQVNALNSGINSTKVTNYDDHINNKQNPHQITKSQIGLCNVNNTSDINKPVSTLQQAELDKKVNINQGTSYNGKLLGIVEGNVIPVDPPQGGAAPQQLATKLDKTNEIKKIAVVTEMPKAIDLYTLYLVVEEEGEWPGLKFTSQQDNNILSYSKVENSQTNTNIHISTDGKTWTQWDGSNITLNNGESRYIWNKTDTFSISSYDCIRFNCSNLAINGNIMSLLNFNEIKSYCFSSLFNSNFNLVINNLYLPATTLAEGCYSSMFYNCLGLTITPELPATNLAKNCYESMFLGCSSLTTTPELPAIILSEGCYKSMFEGCTSISNVPVLSATTLATGCYEKVFKECRSLQGIKLGYIGYFNSNFTNWVDGVSSSGTLYYNGSDTTRGISAIPTNWSVQTF